MKKKLFMLLLCFVIIQTGCGAETENTGQLEETQQEPAEKENKETSESVAQQGMTESEKVYWETAKPYVLEILQNNQSITNSQKNGENWSDTVKQSAQKIIENGDYLENLEYTDDTKTIGTLIQLFGYNMSHAYENYMDAMTNSDMEKFEFYQMDYKTAVCQINEINFYTTHGVEISKQLESDIKNLVGEHIFNSVNLSSGSNYLTLVLNSDYLEDKKALKNSSLMEAHDVLKNLSQNQYYNYLAVNLGVNCKFNDGTESLIMILEFDSQRRSEIKFDEVYWINLPELASNYTDKF